MLYGLSPPLSPEPETNIINLIIIFWGLKPFVLGVTEYHGLVQVGFSMALYTTFFEPPTNNKPVLDFWLQYMNIMNQIILKCKSGFD